MGDRCWEEEVIGICLYMDVSKMDGLYWKTLLKWMIWGGTIIFGNTHIYIILYYFKYTVLFYIYIFIV